MACNGYTRRTTSSSNAQGCPPTTNTYAHCGDGLGAPCKDMYSTACEEKSNMQNLNDRLANYLQKLRGMQQQPNIDPALYRDAMQMLENEMNKMKSGYEGEMAKLRNALEGCCREKNALAANANQCGSSLSDLQAQVNSLQGQLQKALADTQAVCGQMANKDKKLADLTACLNASQDELGAMKPEYNRLKQDANECRRRLDCELKTKADEDCKLRGMLDKSTFDANNKDQQIRDLQNRLKAASDITVNLEAKIGKLSANDGTHMNAMLDKMRNDTMGEMKRQQQASDSALTKSLQALKCQIDTDSQDKNAMAEEKMSLQDIVRQLQAKLGDLEGRLTAACTDNAQLKADLDRERTCSQQEIRNLEQKLRQLHEQMMSKMKECSQARDQQVSLNTEIGNYKMLIDAADQKLAQQPLPPVAKSTSYSNVKRSVSVGPSRSTHATMHCQSMSPANVLGAPLSTLRANHGGACCGSCASGGPCDTGNPCDSKLPPQTARYTCEQYGQKPSNNATNTRITADFKPDTNGYQRTSTSSRTFSTRPW